eukprot:TRINITY_DN10886_c0_g1_i1.p1 TRINITY_DN10886_c0_g1~~TRINITY_DN10886_c0_g1_i1.p1  ORF type:complete len:336 (-),score=64.16 TRINITY_DN10886_c0_g1_i1:133-1140(-)
MLSGHGAIAIGSETSGDIRDVSVSHSYFVETDAGLRVKTMQGRGGIVERIKLTEIHMLRVPQPIDIEMEYHGMYEKPEDPSNSPSPVLRNIDLYDIIAFRSKEMAVVNWGSNLNVNCLEHSPCSQFNFHNVYLLNYTNPFSQLVKVRMDYISGKVDGMEYDLSRENSNNVGHPDHPWKITIDNPRDYSLILDHLVVDSANLINNRNYSEEFRAIEEGLENTLAIANTHSDLEWESIPFDKYWKKPWRKYNGTCGAPVISSCTEKQTDMWKKFQANQQRYELNWRKFRYYEEQTIANESKIMTRNRLLVIVFVFCLLAIWWCFGRKKDRRRLTRVL